MRRWGVVVAIDAKSVALALPVMGKALQRFQKGRDKT